jgi:hypothetical protein
VFIKKSGRVSKNIKRCARKTQEFFEKTQDIFSDEKTGLLKCCKIGK